MNKVQHLWNLVNHLTSNPAVEASGLQSYYVERCRKLQDNVELPKKIFGPGEMCSYCGSIWSKNEHRVRIKFGKKRGKCIKKIMKKNEKRKIGKIEESLLKKSLKNFDNKMVIRCSVCSKDSVIKLKKPERVKLKSDKNEKTNCDDGNPTRKRKKRTKDRTAGLIIAEINKNVNNDSTKSLLTKKVKGTNLNRLGDIIKKNLTPSKKSTLHQFITELM